MSERAPDLAYYALAALLVLGSLFAMRLPLRRALRMAAAWAAIFAIFFVLFAFRDELFGLEQRLKAEAMGSAIARDQQVRIPIADDGHFWVEARVNGRSSRFLVDTGASVTTISREMARAAGISDNGRRIVVDTANGPAPATQAYADRLEVQSITRLDFPIDISDRDQTNVLGMNFLSSLSSWRVEGNYLVLRP